MWVHRRLAQRTKLFPYVSCFTHIPFTDRNKKIRVIETLEILETLIMYAKRRNDKLGEELLGRLMGIVDLVSEEARYHLSCYNMLRNKPADHQVSMETAFSIPLEIKYIQ